MRYDLRCPSRGHSIGEIPIGSPCSLLSNAVVPQPTDSTASRVPAGRRGNPPSVLGDRYALGMNAWTILVIVLVVILVVALMRGRI